MSLLISRRGHYETVSARSLPYLSPDIAENSVRTARQTFNSHRVWRDKN